MTLEKIKEIAEQMPESPEKQTALQAYREIQQRLKNTGKARYNPGKVDGIIGTASRTAWDNYECDKQAIKAF